MRSAHYSKFPQALLGHSPNTASSKRCYAVVFSGILQALRHTSSRPKRRVLSRRRSIRDHPIQLHTEAAVLGGGGRHHLISDKSGTTCPSTVACFPEGRAGRSACIVDATLLGAYHDLNAHPSLVRHTMDRINNADNANVRTFRIVSIISGRRLPACVVGQLCTKI